MTGIRAYAVAAVALTLMLFFSAFSHAADPGEERTIISADTIEQHGEVFHGEGSVVVEAPGSTLNADRVRYDRATEDVVAEGSVYYEDDRSTVKASKAEINLRSETGVLYDADVFFKEQGYRVYGSRIEKPGYNRYFLDVGSITTCPGPVPAWCIKGRNVDLIVGDRVKTRHATFRVKDTPVLYTPYFWAPVITERKTGFLMQRTGYSNRKGFTWMQPFFWAISANRDATFFADVYSRRGVGFGAEYRYIEASGMEGSVNFYNIRDTELHRSFRELRATHRHRWRGFRGFYDINYVNQKDFYREYELYLLQSARRFLESQAEFSLRDEHARLYARGRYLRELKDGEDQGSVLQKLPEVGIFITPKRLLGPVVLTAETSVANFTRDTGVDGKRLDTGLTLTSVLGRGPSLSQSLGFGYAFYDLDGLSPGVESDLDRGFLSYGASLRSSLAKSYGDIEHIVMHDLTYSYRRFDGDTPPLLDATELQGDVSELEVSVYNRLRDALAGEFLTVRLSDAYDFRAGDRPFQPIALDISYRRDFSLAVGLRYDVYDSVITGSDSRLGVSLERLDMSAGHTYRRGDITMFNVVFVYKASPAVSLKSEAWYDSNSGELTRLGLGLIYSSECWALAVDYTKRPSEHIVFLTVTLKGLGDVRI
jgi:LPS-assembly protein